MFTRHAFLLCVYASVAAAWQPSTTSIQTTRRNTATLLAMKHDALNTVQDNDVVLDNASRRTFLQQLSSSFIASAALPLVAIADESADTAKAVQNVVKEERDLDNKLKQEEADETKSIEDTKNLIDEIKDASTAADEESLIVEEQKIAKDTDALIKEEEQIVGETQAMITEIETIESETKELDKASKSEGTKSEEFVNKLKQRVEEKEDLITKLKRESELYRDPETGKFKPMSQDEFKKRALSTETDYDYLQMLKDSLTKNEEFERDLEAFEGLVERNFGGIMKELKKDEDVVENEFSIIKDGADAVIKQLRKLF